MSTSQTGTAAAGRAGVDARRRLDPPVPAHAEPVGEDIEVGARSTLKSAVSRTFVERTRTALGELMSRQLGDLRLAVMMLDGLELKGRMMIVALGITTEDVKIRARAVGRNDREHDRRHGAAVGPGGTRARPRARLLFVIDGSKALRKAVRTVFGEVPVQRCVRHKQRHVMRHLAGATDPGQGPAAQGVVGDRLPASARAAAPTRGRTQAHAPRRRRIAAVTVGRDADRDQARDQRPATSNAAIHQPGRVDDRPRPHDAAQRQEPVLWGGGLWETAAGCLKLKSRSAR